MTKTELKKATASYLARHPEEVKQVLEHHIERVFTAPVEMVSRRGYLALETETESELITFRIGYATPDMVVINGVNIVDKASEFTPISIAI